MFVLYGNKNSEVRMDKQSNTHFNAIFTTMAENILSFVYSSFANII